MKIRMLSLYAGPSGVIQPDEVVDLPDAEARELLAGRYAVSAESVPVENAELPRKGAVKAAK